jgi:hygromycin-B 4-O-kinase
VSKAKTRVPDHLAEQFLAKRFDLPATGIQRLKGGESAEVFLFEAAGTEYVLRIHSSSSQFIKDRYAFANFRSPAVPIPEIVGQGRFDIGHFFAVSVKAPGVTHSELSVADRLAAVPSVLRTVDAIHATDVSGSKGYGYWRGSGSARCATLRAHLESTAMTGRAALRDKPYGDQVFHRSLVGRMRSLFEYLPEHRCLVHGDFGHDNLLVDHGNVSAVLDWGGSAYGDFMHDVAWLDFWDSDIGYGHRVREHYHRTGKEVPNYDERLQLHKLTIAAKSLGFYAVSEQEEVYRRALERYKAMNLA